MNRKSCLKLAKQAVCSRRAYGPPEQNFERIARLWAVHFENRYALSVEFDGIDVAIMLGLLKIARLEETPDHADSWIDLAGYAACGAELMPAEKAPKLSKISTEKEFESKGGETATTAGDYNSACVSRIGE